MPYEKMVDSAILCNKKLCQDEPGVLVLNITSQKWKEVLLRKAMVNIIRIRNENEFARHIRKLLVAEFLCFNSDTEVREPFITLRFPIILQNGDKVRIFILKDGVPEKSEVVEIKK